MQTDDLLALADAYGVAMGLSRSTVGLRACGNNRIFHALSDGKGCHSNTLADAEEWFRANWPAGAVWPAGVPR